MSCRVLSHCSFHSDCSLVFVPLFMSYRVFLIVHFIVFIVLFGVLVVVHLCVISVRGGDVVESSADR
jgi:hypothetical protein